MDISLLSRMVKELVLKNDRVSLPGLGVFACEYVPASFSDKGFVINPPYRRVFFRSRKEDDGILVLLLGLPCLFPQLYLALLILDGCKLLIYSLELSYGV